MPSPREDIPPLPDWARSPVPAWKRGAEVGALIGAAIGLMLLVLRHKVVRQ